MSTDDRPTTRPVYAFRVVEENTRDEQHGAKVAMTITLDDAARWQATEEKALGESPSRHARGPWTRVRDLDTGRDVELRTAPCGLGCRCAAEMREVPDAG